MSVPGTRTPPNGIVTVAWLKKRGVCGIPRWFAKEYPRGMRLTRANLLAVARKHYSDSRAEFRYSLPWVFLWSHQNLHAPSEFYRFYNIVGENAFVHNDKVVYPTIARQVEAMCDILQLPHGPRVRADDE